MTQAAACVAWCCLLAVCRWDNICVGGNPMSERNYPCDNIIIVYFGGNETTLNAVRGVPTVAFPCRSSPYDCSALSRGLRSLAKLRSKSSCTSACWAKRCK